VSHNNPGFTTAEALLRERAVQVVARTGGLPIDLFVKLVDAGIDPELVQVEGTHAIWRGGSVIGSLKDHESTHESVPDEDDDDFINHFTNTEEN
jgi:hypothetical protein